MTWPIVKIGDIFDIRTGKLDANASSDDGSFPFFTCAKEPLRIDRWAYDLDAILIAGNGDLNVKHYRGKFEAYQRTYILSLKQPTANSMRYLYWFMESYMDTLRSQSIGGIIKYIKLSMLTDAKIPLPPLEEQKRIAGILDQADALRRLRARALEKLNTLGQAVFQEMFASADDGPRVPMAHFLHVRSSLADPQKNEHSSLAHVGPEHIASGSGEISWNRVRTCAEDGVTSGKYIFLAGDIIFSKIRPYLNKVAITDRRGMCSADMYALHTNPSIATQEYIKYVLSSKNFLTYASTVSNRANIPKINRDQLLSFSCYIPPLFMQEDFKATIMEIESKSALARRALQKSENLFYSLQADAFQNKLQGRA